MQNLTYQNITMTNVGMPFILYSYYNEIGTPNNISPAFAAALPIAAVTATEPAWRNIMISNVTATATSGHVAGIIWGRTEFPATNVFFSHVTITASLGFDVYNGNGIQFSDCQIIVPPGTNTFELFNAGLTFTNSAPGAGPVTLDGLTSTNSLSLVNAQASMTAGDALGANPLSLNASTLTVHNTLVLPAAETVNFALGTNQTRVAATANLVLNSLLNVTNADGFGVGTYTLFTYGGAFGGHPVLGATPVGFPYVYQLDFTNTPGQINFVVSPAAAPTPPTFGGITLADGGNVVISGSGGTSNATYYVLASTNLALPVGEWTPIATNVFDDSGNFIFTNSTGLAPAQYYRIEVP